MFNLFSLIGGLIFLCCYAYVAMLRVDRAKPIGWMLINIAWLILFAMIYWFDGVLYFSLGAMAMLMVLVHDMIKEKLKPNMYLFGLLLSTFMFYPIGVFEKIYSELKSRLPH